MSPVATQYYYCDPAVLEVPTQIVFTSLLGGHYTTSPACTVALSRTNKSAVYSFVVIAPSGQSFFEPLFDNTDTPSTANTSLESVKLFPLQLPGLTTFGQQIFKPKIGAINIVSDEK